VLQWSARSRVGLYSLACATGKHLTLNILCYDNVCVVKKLKIANLRTNETSFFTLLDNRVNE